MKVVKSEDKEWLEKKGYSKKIFLDEKELNYPGSLIQKIKIKPGEGAEEHYHKKQTEIFYFLTENGYWIINGERMNFKKGDVLVLEPFDKHITLNESKQDYIYIAFKFNYEDEDLYWT
jgi:oxalate decarboxylase/phosphoglucose isomerase-like protein (cupin superfamily)